MSPLITDLALILILAGIVTIVFRRLGQPLVLGYIVAGFLAGPHMPYTPTVSDTASIETWSSIGVIFLMFSLGLEFSFKKIVKMGVKPIVSACLVMAFMAGMGSTAGRMLGWSDSDCLFLGGMLAMSSTTIIYKAFADLGLRTRKFAAEVLSVLIIEDLLGILLMVILSASAASARFEGGELVMSMLKLGFFLVFWFVVGIWGIPLLLARVRRWLTGETLLVASLGLCFLMVVLADKAGYSSAFGAFMMGSILAETLEAERIDHLVTSVKDLFGAVFFVSVGMLVSPQVLAVHWPAILLITLAVLVGQTVLGTCAFLLSGHPLKVAMQCGFSLAQIGEFAFILAALGQSLGVTSSFLYPIVVAVSIVTTFLTPYMIRAAAPAYTLLERHLPALVLHGIARHSRNAAGDDAGDVVPASAASSGIPAAATSMSRVWGRFLRHIVVQTGAYLVMTFAAVTLSLSILLQIFRHIFEPGGVNVHHPVHWVSNGLCGLLSVAVLSIFLRPIVMRKNHSVEAQEILKAGGLHRAAFRLLLVLRFVLATAFVFQVVEYLCPWRYYYNALVAALLMLVIIRLRCVKYYSIRMERVFTHNLRRRDEMARREAGGGVGYARRLRAHDIHMERVHVPSRSLWAGHRLLDLDFSNRNGVTVAAVIRHTRDDEDIPLRIDIPSASTTVYPGDILEIIGDDASIESFAARSRQEVIPAAALPSSRSSLPDGLKLQRMVAGDGFPLLGRTLAESGLHDRYQCMLIGIEDSDGHILRVGARHVIARHQVLWIVGRKEGIDALKRAGKAENFNNAP